MKQPELFHNLEISLFGMKQPELINDLEGWYETTRTNQ